MSDKPYIVVGSSHLYEDLQGQIDALRAKWQAAEADALEMAQIADKLRTEMDSDHNELVQLRAENKQLLNDLKVAEDVLRLTARREDDLEAENERLRAAEPREGQMTQLPDVDDLTHYMQATSRLSAEVQRLAEARAKLATAAAIIRGFVGCAEARVWPSDGRISGALDWLAAIDAPTVGQASET